MLRKYKITYVKVETIRTKPRHHTLEIEATSKYDAKQRFYRKYPEYGIVKVEEVEE